MTSITVFFYSGAERTLTDEEDRIFNFEVVDGHLRLSERLRLVPGSVNGNFKAARCTHVYPPGTWREVEIDYGS